VWGGLTEHRTASVISRFIRALEVRAQIFAVFDAHDETRRVAFDAPSQRSSIAPGRVVIRATVGAPSL
jgi:hypothetical protein